MINTMLKYVGSKQQYLEPIYEFAGGDFEHVIEPFAGKGVVSLNYGEDIPFLLGDTNPIFIMHYIEVLEHYESEVLDEKVEEAFELSKQLLTKEDFWGIRRLLSDTIGVLKFHPHQAYYAIQMYRSIVNSNVVKEDYNLSEMGLKIVRHSFWLANQFFNKYCFRGMYRFNKSGLINTSYCPSKKQGESINIFGSGLIESKANLQRLGQRLTFGSFFAGDYTHVLENAPSSFSNMRNLIFIDPPYVGENFYSQEIGEEFYKNLFLRLDIVAEKMPTSKVVMTHTRSEEFETLVNEFKKDCKSKVEVEYFDRKSGLFHSQHSKGESFQNSEKQECLVSIQM